MKVNLTTIFKMLLILAAFISSANCAYAWTYTSSGPWASFSFSDGWTVYQDAWGAPNDNSCVLYANSSGNFACYVNYTGGGIKNYCHTQKDVDLPISNSYYCTSSFNYTAPDNPWWCFFYDVWTANMQDELEIIEGWNGDGIWGTLVASNVTIGGKLISEVRQANNGYNNVIIFTPASKRTSGSEDIMAFFVWALNKGLLSNSTLHQVSFGVEVTYTSGWQQFTVNSFSASWGSNGGSSSGNVSIQNKATGLFIDGMGRTSDGSNAGQWSNSGSAAQQWVSETAGSYVKFKNSATGLYLDGMGRTSDGSIAGQWSSSSSYNQQWTIETYGSYKRIKNRASGLYLDGMYWTSNGSDLGQWGDSGSDGQQWTVTSLKSTNASTTTTSDEENNNILLFPNPFTSEINLEIDNPELVNNIVVVDILGRQIEVINHGDVKNIQPIGASLKPGMYIVRVNSSSKTLSYKITKK